MYIVVQHSFCYSYTPKVISNWIFVHLHFKNFCLVGPSLFFLWTIFFILVQDIFKFLDMKSFSHLGRNCWAIWMKVYGCKLVVSPLNCVSFYSSVSLPYRIGVSLGGLGSRLEWHLGGIHGSIIVTTHLSLYNNFQLCSHFILGVFISFIFG